MVSGDNLSIIVGATKESPLIVSLILVLIDNLNWFLFIILICYSADSV